MRRPTRAPHAAALLAASVAVPCATSTAALSPLLSAALLATALAAPPANAAEAQRIPVARLAAPPRVDGDLADWNPRGWIAVAIEPALAKSERPRYGLAAEDDRNQTGSLKVELQAGVAGGRFYLALRYPDAAADTEHRPWRLTGERYAEGREREDMLAVRFHLDGDYDRSMLGEQNYRVDVWLWSAARTNPSGIAEDMTHEMGTRLIDGAAEYVLPSGKTAHIRKQRDAGDAPYRVLPRPRQPAGERSPSFALASPAGSAADVAAKGKWKAGQWQIEFSRALDTGNADDAPFRPGLRILGQVAVFDRGYAEHKSVSEPLLFDFSGLD